MLNKISFILFAILLQVSCEKNNTGKVRVVNASDSTIAVRHAAPASYQTKILKSNQILERNANGQNCIEYYKDYTFSVKDGAEIIKDWRHATNWTEYFENPGTDDESTVCEFRIENNDL